MIKIKNVEKLNPNQSFCLVKGTNHSTVPNVPGKKQNSTVDVPVFETIIITDGKILDRTNLEHSEISEYEINGSKHYIHTLTTENISFKQANYVIKLLIASENRNNGFVSGYFNLIKQYSIYLSNPNDRRLLSTVKSVLKKLPIMEIHNIENLKSIFSLNLSDDMVQLDEGIYQIQKQPIIKK